MRPVIVQFTDQCAIALFVIGIVIVIARHIARLLGPFFFFLVGLQDGALHELTAAGVDGMSDVGVQLGPAIGVAHGAILIELRAALVAESSAQVVLAAAAPAAIGELAARHR